MGVQYLDDGNPDGACLGKDSTRPIGFLGATPVARQAATTDLKDLLVTFGLITDSGASPLNLDAGAFTCGTIAATDNITISAGKNVVLATNTGTKFGTATNQKIGFFNATPIVQTTFTSAITTFTSHSTNAWGYSTSSQANEIVTLLNQIRAWAVTIGFSA